MKRAKENCSSRVRCELSHIGEAHRCKLSIKARVYRYSNIQTELKFIWVTPMTKLWCATRPTLYSFRSLYMSLSLAELPSGRRPKILAFICVMFQAGGRGSSCAGVRVIPKLLRGPELLPGPTISAVVSAVFERNGHESPRVQATPQPEPLGQSDPHHLLRHRKLQHGPQILEPTVYIQGLNPQRQMVLGLNPGSLGRLLSFEAFWDLCRVNYLLAAGHHQVRFAFNPQPLTLTPSPEGCTLTPPHSHLSCREFCVRQEVRVLFVYPLPSLTPQVPTP